MLSFGHRRGVVQPKKKSRNYHFLGKIFKFEGGSGPPVPPSGSAHANFKILALTVPDRVLSVTHASQTGLDGQTQTNMPPQLLRSWGHKNGSVFAYVVGIY